MVTLFYKKNIFLSYVPIVIILVCVIGVFFPIIKTFYSQDEWLGYGTFLAQGIGYVFPNTTGIYRVLWGEGRILSSLLYYISFKLFPLDIIPIALFALVFHFINAVLLFFLIKKILKAVLPSLLGTLFFVLSSVSQGAVTWAAAVAGTLPSTTLILLSLFLFFNFIETGRKKWLIKTFVLIYLSLLFKETGVFLFLFLPMISLVFKGYSISKFVKTYWYYLLATLFIVFVRIIEYKFVPHAQSLFLTGSSQFYYSSFIFRGILYPLTSFSLSIVPPPAFLNFARSVANIYYPFFPVEQFILISQTVVLDLLSVIFSSIIFVLFFYFLKVADRKWKPMVVFWLTFIITGFLPYIIISKSYGYLDSRYYYLASTGWAVLFAWVLDLSFNRIKNIHLRLLVIFIYIFFLFVHGKIVITDIEKLVKESRLRINILNQVSTLKPELKENKNIFYITGDADFLLPGNKVPFQQGFGYTLMTIYYPSRNIPIELLESGYLFELGSQGYREVGGLGFGYFSDFNQLKVSAKDNRFNKNSIIGFYYDSKNGKLTDITQELNDFN